MTAVQPALLIALGLGIQGAIAAPAHTKLVIPEKIEFLLEDYCFSCHEDGLVKGDVRLDNLDTLTLDARLDLLNRMQELARKPEMMARNLNVERECQELLGNEWTGILDRTRTLLS